MSLRITTLVNNLNSLSKLVYGKKHLFALTVFLTLILGAKFSVAQTTFTLVSATGDGGFETGTSFALNNWSTTLGTAAQNQWVCNSVATGFTGARCAYITNATATNPHAYTTTTTRVSHLYRNFTIPTTASSANLSFRWKGAGESTFDYLSVYFEPATNTVPVYGTLKGLAGTAPTGIVNAATASTAPTTRTLYNIGQAGYTAFQTVNIAIPAVYLNNTAYRVTFVWRNDNSAGTQPPAAIDNVQITYIVPPACAGTPAAAVAAISSLSGCSGQNITLSTTGAAAGAGISSIWQSSTNNSTWNNITGATATSTVITSPAVLTYYRYVTTCSVSALSANSNTVSFTPNTCTGSITMTDSYGDGWDGATMQLFVNGSLFQTFGSTFTTGYTQTANFCLPAASTYSLVYNNGGSWPGEIGASLTINSTLVYSIGAGGAAVGSTLVIGNACPPPATVVPNCAGAPTAPTNGQTGVNPAQILSWPAVSGATSYDVYFGTNNPPTNIVNGTNQAGTTYNPGTLLSSTNYYWRIVPRNAIGAATGCSVWSFSTGLAGCTSGTYYLTYTPLCTGSQEDYTTCTFAGEYNILALTAGITYTLGTTTANDFITVRSSNTILASGISPINFAPSTTANYTVQINNNAACATDFDCHVTWIKCPVPQSNWQSQFLSMNTGSSNWCAGEVRTVTVTVKNIGIQAWTNATPDINIGIKWNADADYFVRADAGGLASGATGTYTFSIVAPTVSGPENLTFDVANEGNFWFGNNNNGGGPGNTVYSSSNITIVPYANVSAGTNTSICVGNSTTLNASATATINALNGLTTTYAAGNGCSNGNMFDIVSNGLPLTITGFSINPGASGIQNISVYFKTGTYVGSETNAAAWTLVGTYAINGSIGVPLQVNVANFTIPASSTYGIYVNGNVNYTNSTTPYSNADMTINVGAGLCGSFATVNAGRAFNGAVIYTKSVQPALSYSWSPSGSLSSNSILNPLATPSISTNYSIAVTSASTCPASSSISVTINSPNITPTPTSGDYIWCGNTSTGWSVPSNWYVYNGTSYSVAAVASTSNDDVIISANGTCIIQQPLVGVPGSAQNITVNSGASLILNSGSTITAKNITIASTGTLAMNGAANSTLNVSGNWQDNGTFNAGVGTVNFNGTTVQSINKSSGNEVFANVIVNKASGSLTLNSPTEIGTNLTLTSGLVNSDATNLLIINDNATATGAGNTSHVVGPVRKIGDESFTFPVGKGGIYAPTAIGAPSLTTDHFTAEYFNSDPNVSYNVTSKDITIDHVSACEYWMINQTAGSSAVTVNLSWDTPRSCGVTLPSDLLVARWDGAVWRDHGNGATAGTNSAGNVTTSAVVSNFSPFALASKTGNNPLPIELTNFDLSCENEKVIANWSTASEVNNDFFTVGRSADGLHFEPISTIKGNGTTNTKNSYSFTDANSIDGLSYYQLKQTDFNGQSKTYSLKSVDCKNKNSELFIYPNPNKGIFVIEGTTFGCDLIVTDIVGKEIYNAKGKDYKTQVNLNDFSSGIYYITITRGIEKITKKVVID